MELHTRGVLKQLYEMLVPTSDVSLDSSEASHTRLTPQSDSEDSDLEMDDLGESSKLRQAAEERGTVWTAGEPGHDDEDDNDSDDGDEGGSSSRRPQRRASISTVQSYQLYTPDEERAVVRKFDRKLVLFVALLYMLSFLDRSSITPRLSSYHTSTNIVS